MNNEILVVDDNADIRILISGILEDNGFLDSDGFLYAVGTGSNGQLGQENTTNYNTLVKVKGVGGSGFRVRLARPIPGAEHGMRRD